MSTQDYKTRSEIIKCNNLYTPEYALSALDIGYSAIKGFSANRRICIPAFVREPKGEMMGVSQPTDILYRNENGQLLIVGTLAAESVSDRDTNDADNTMFTRNRYFSTQFLVLARVGLALTLGPNVKKPICLQTGLPPAYRRADTPLLKEALAGTHHFWLKIGSNNWQEYKYELNEDNIFVLDQPVGSIYSASKKDDGTTILCSDGYPYINHKILVLDGGFGTLDIFSVTNRVVDSSNTFNDLGMRAIFEGVTQEVFEMYGKEVHPHTLQKYLARGFIPISDRRTRSTKELDINDIFARHTHNTCVKAMERIETAYNNLEEYDYLLVTGGTGAAWFDDICERYKNMQTLQVINACQNPEISPIYNNVRGYYIFRALTLMK